MKYSDWLAEIHQDVYKDKNAIVEIISVCSIFAAFIRDDGS